AFGDALVVEMIEFFPEDEIFHQRRAAFAGLELVVIVGDAHALIGAQIRAGGIDARMAVDICLLAALVGVGVVGGRAAVGFGMGVFAHGIEPGIAADIEGLTPNVR